MSAPQVILTIGIAIQCVKNKGLSVKKKSGPHSHIYIFIEIVIQLDMHILVCVPWQIYLERMNLGAINTSHPSCGTNKRTHAFVHPIVSTIHAFAPT